VNIYTYSKYAFATLHVHGAIYKEKGLLTTGGKEFKNKEEILQLLEAVWRHLKWLSCTAEATKEARMMSVKETTWLTGWQKGNQKS
jgi:hypothetical protein